MLKPVPTSDCELAREAASARLDGELSEHENARLELHLRDCVACSAYVLDLEAIAEKLRTAPLEQPSRRIALPQRRRLADARLVAGVAAGLAAVAATFTIGHAFGTHSGSPARTASTVENSTLQSHKLTQHELAMLRRIGAANGVRVGRVILL